MHWGTLPFEANRAFSTYGNPDLLGGFLIFSVTVALGLALLEQRLVWRLVYWVGFGLNGLALIVAFTRGAWIGGAVSLALLGVIAWRQRATMRRIDWVPAGVFIAAGVGIIWRSLSSPSDVMNFGKRLGSIFQFGGGSGQTRTEIWQAAVAAIKERPILGWGADTFRLVFPKFKPVEYVRDAGGSSVADNAHDYPLQLASGHRHPRHAHVLRHLRLGRGAVLRDGVPALGRPHAHHRWVRSGPPRRATSSSSSSASRSPAPRSSCG